MDTKLLGIYLNDHLAGSVVGGELAKRAASSNEGTELGDFLAELAGRSTSEREVLKSCWTISASPRIASSMPIAWAAEKAGRLKPNGQLDRLLAAFAPGRARRLMLGVTGKLGMWRALAATAVGPGEFGSTS